MSEYARNNLFFQTAKEFREVIFEFFDVTWPQIAHNVEDQINDNFQTINRYLHLLGYIVSLGVAIILN